MYNWIVYLHVASIFVFLVQHPLKFTSLLGCGNRMTLKKYLPYTISSQPTIPVTCASPI